MGEAARKLLVHSNGVDVSCSVPRLRYLNGRCAHSRKDLRRAGWIYSGGPEGARAVLATIAGSIITVAATTFSITIAVLSMASGQFGPRLLRNFMRDRGSQAVLGAFVATFLYCLLVLRTVRGTNEDTYVPHLSVTIGTILSVLCLGALIYFIHHTAESIQVTTVIDVVGRDLERYAGNFLKRQVLYTLRRCLNCRHASSRRQFLDTCRT